MRKFSIYSLEKSVVIPLNEGAVFATSASGFGNAFTINYKEGAQKRIIEKKQPNFEAIKLTIHFGADGTEPRAAYRNFMGAMATLGVGEFLLEEDADGVKKTCHATILKAPKSEVQKSGVITENFEFDRLSYWFREGSEDFSLIATDSESEGYPLEFPFSFSGVYLKKEIPIKNDFFEPIPVTVLIDGKAESDDGDIMLTLSDKNTDAVAAQIRLTRGIRVGESILLNPDARKVMSYYKGEYHDAYVLTDKTHDTFLFIPPGNWILKSNHRYEEGGRVGISYKKYLYD